MSFADYEAPQVEVPFSDYVEAAEFFAGGASREYWPATRVRCALPTPDDTVRLARELVALAESLRKLCGLGPACEVGRAIAYPGFQGKFDANGIAGPGLYCGPWKATGPWKVSSFLKFDTCYGLLVTFVP